MRITLIITCFILSGFSAFYGQPLMRDNSDAVTVIITTTTVFAGFMVAIITILGDPGLIPEGSWRTAEARRESIEARIIRHMWLFFLYLITIGFLFVGVLMNKASDEVVKGDVKIWIERIYLFFATLSFLFTFSLPRALWKFQMSRVEAEINFRREKIGIKE